MTWSLNVNLLSRRDEDAPLRCASTLGLDVADLAARVRRRFLTGSVSQMADRCSGAERPPASATVVTNAVGSFGRPRSRLTASGRHLTRPAGSE